MPGERLKQSPGKIEELVVAFLLLPLMEALSEAQRIRPYHLGRAHLRCSC